MTRYELLGQPDDLRQRLLEFDEHGHLLRFGSWASKPTADDVSAERLCDWTRFEDYIMEGFVQYDLRINDGEDRLVVEVRKLGSNRDQHVDWFLEWSFRQLRIEWQRVETTAQ